jgi:lysylphosphatidylglycerol synthetase-like protein (DUF2156 family)
LPVPSLALCTVLGLRVNADCTLFQSFNWNSICNVAELLLRSRMKHFYLFVYLLVVLGLELRAFTLSHSTSSPPPFLWWIFFKIGSHEIFARGWLGTLILLISASRVARITGVSHQGLANILKSSCPQIAFNLEWKHDTQR